MITLTKPTERKGWRSLGAVIWLIDREVGLLALPLVLDLLVQASP